MVFYMNNHVKNVILVAFGIKVWLRDRLEEDQNHPRWEKVKQRFEIALKEIDEATKDLMVPCEMKQRKTVESASRGSKIIVVSEADPRAEVKMVKVSEETLQYLVGCAVDANCRFCERDKNQMRKCHLRYHLLRHGPNDIDEGIATGACEFSRL